MIGKNLELIIKHWGMKQEGFADLFPNMNRFKISSYVNSKSKPSVEFMIILRRLTGLEIELLYLGEVSKEEIPPAPLVDQVINELKKDYKKDYKAPQNLPELFERVVKIEGQIEQIKKGINSKDEEEE